MRGERRHSAEQRCPTEVLLGQKQSKPSSSNTAVTATLGKGAPEVCQGERGTALLLYLTLAYLNLNKHKQLEATILSGADTEQQVLNFVQLSHLGRQVQLPGSHSPEILA